MIWAGHIPYKGEVRNTYRILARKSPGMISTDRAGRGSEAVANNEV
jgi:hypothetical protein